MCRRRHTLRRRTTRIIWYGATNLGAGREKTRPALGGCQGIAAAALSHAPASAARHHRAGAPSPPAVGDPGAVAGGRGILAARRPGLASRRPRGAAPVPVRRRGGRRRQRPQPVVRRARPRPAHHHRAGDRRRCAADHTVDHPHRRRGKPVRDAVCRPGRRHGPAGRPVDRGGRRPRLGRRPDGRAGSRLGRRARRRRRRCRRRRPPPVPG